MSWSLNLGRVFGIKVFVHWTFLILIGWVVFNEYQKGSGPATTLLTVLYVFSLFACVVLHELGHSLTARRYGIKTSRITLSPIGGVASLEQMPEKPGQELLVAIAGPAVNVLIAILLIPFLGPLDSVLSAAKDGSASISPENFIFSLFMVNIFLVLFNAIPAFPMDGGRVLRALLAMFMGKIKATRIASRLGQGIAIIFFIAGIFYNPFLVFIGIFVFFGAYSENLMVSQIEYIKGHTVREAMLYHFGIIDINSSVETALGKVLSGSEKIFIVSDGDKFSGVLSLKDMLTILKERGKDAQVKDFLHSGMRQFSPEEKLETAFIYTQHNRDLSCPVFENGNLIGMINSDKINEFIMVQSALKN